MAEPEEKPDRDPFAVGLRELESLVQQAEEATSLEEVLRILRRAGELARELRRVLRAGNGRTHLLQEQPGGELREEPFDVD